MKLTRIPMQLGLAALFLAGAVQAQISLTGGTYSENFDTWFAANPNTLPAGWDVVANGYSVASPPVGVTATVANSDAVWAGTSTSGNPVTAVFGYNAALQTDINQTGDGVADRCLALYETSASSTRYITATLTNNTGATITQLAISFQVQASAVRFDNTSTNLRYDGFRLLVDPENDNTFADTTLEATITNAVFNFALGGGTSTTVWNSTTSFGWATAAMLTVADANVATVSGNITGLSIPNGATFKLRWNSHNGGGANPTAVAGRTKQNINIGVDDLSITPTLAAATPNAPSGLTAAAASSTQINLSWVDNSGDETGFKIQRSATSGGPWTDVTTTAADATTYNDASLVAGTPYFYQVLATNGSGDSSPSNEATATTWTGLEQWRFDYFGSIANSGNGADTFDFDNDGIDNLVEYALAGGDPTVANPAIAPTQGVTNDGGSDYLTLTVNKNTAATGITYLVQVGDDLDGWSAGVTVSETASTLVVRDSVAISGANRRFIRLKVTQP